jgi:hypothetical protein
VALDIVTTYFGSPDTKNKTLGTGGRITIASNPDLPGSVFHQISDGMQDGWNIYQIGRPDVCVDFSKDILANSIRDMYGEESPMYKNYVLGEHSLSDASALIPEHVILAQRQRSVLNSPPYYMGVDPAGGVDRDYSAITLRSTNLCHEFIRINNEDLDNFTQRVFTMIEDKRPETCGIDEVGIGQGMPNTLRHMITEWNFKHTNDPIHTSIIEVRSNDKNNRDRFSNLMTHLIWISREWLHYCGHIPPDLPNSDVLVHELRNLKSVIDGQSNMKYDKELSKKSLGRSPDLAESFVLSFINTIIIKPMIQVIPPAHRQRRFFGAQKRILPRY